MTTIPIPAWNAVGLLPPLDEAQPTSAERSPYVVSLSDFVLRFGQSEERRRLLDGFLRYRKALHAVDLTSGFQWVDGSFLENIELLEARPPNDLDVVTFYDRPPGQSEAELYARASHLIPAGAAAKRALKTNFHVDPYLVYLGLSPERLVENSAYWYSLWSHRRNREWKGFLQIDLAPLEDAAAQITLTKLGNQGVQP